MWYESDLRVEQVEVIHGLLLVPRRAHVWLVTQRTHGVVDALLFDDGREVGLEAAFAERTRAVGHGDHLRTTLAFSVHNSITFVTQTPDVV